jgi:hypothetical protein
MLIEPHHVDRTKDRNSLDIGRQGLIHAVHNAHIEQLFASVPTVMGLSTTGQ